MLDVNKLPLTPDKDVYFQEYEQRIGNNAEHNYGNDATDAENQTTDQPNQKDTRT